MATDCDDLGDDLQITKITRRAAGMGTWVCGTLNEYRFNAPRTEPSYGISL